MEILENVDDFAVQPPSSSTVVVAANISRKSRYAIKWALEKFVPEGRKVFKMLHVRPCITSIPTPLGNYVPISQARDDVANAYKSEVEWRTIRMLRPFKEMFSENKVEVEVVVIEADDVAQAISREVSKHATCELVIGASSGSMFTRKMKGQNISSRISECTPSFCTVYVVSKGKLTSVRPSNSETSEATVCLISESNSSSGRSAATKDEHSDTKSTSERSEAIKEEASDTSSSIESCSNDNYSSQADQEGLVDSYSHVKHPSLDIQRFQALSTINQTLLNKRPPDLNFRHPSLNVEDRKDRSSYSRNSETSQSGVSNYRSFQTDYPSWYCDTATKSDVPLPPNSSSPESQVDVNFELERLRVEIRHVRGMFAVAQNETINASRQLKNLNKRRMDESAKLKEISLREERARELAREEKEKHEAAKKELELVMDCVKKEASRRKEAESKAARDAKEKQKLEKALEDPGQQYMKFKWEEIESATSSFADDLKIGMGAYGTVYKCNLQNTTAAVKVLHSKEGHGNKEFQQEIEILSKIRHPHLLLLLGACPDKGCLVYEYMENGNLEDRLFRKNNTPPIPWFDRYRIAWEIASALLFLHNSKPKPIIHRDLKPANILLDHNFVSKIGDVGLSTWLPNINSSVSAVFTETDLVGTLCYIDPEYQRSGTITPQSDVYAFGMVILQLLTAKPALALTYNVETAIENGNLMGILDPEAGNWPIEEAQELAVLGISCAELSSSDRPDLEDKVLPLLERLKGVADKVRNVAPSVQSAPPSHFICPILKDVMENPCVAADGYTYDRKEIENWLKENEKSPMTNMPLHNKNLIPNYSLLAAIMEWKSRTQ